MAVGVQFNRAPWFAMLDAMIGTLGTAVATLIEVLTGNPSAHTDRKRERDAQR
jgi:hypothetical protein